MSEYAYGQGTAPIELQEMWLCQRFNMKPSDLDEEDGPRMLLMADLDNVHQIMGKLSRGEKMSATEGLIVRDVLVAKAEKDGSKSTT